MEITEAQQQLEQTPYRLLKQIGAGAMGVVFKAEERRRGRHVVVKLLQPARDGAVCDRFRLEAQALARIRHANVVEVLDWGSTADSRPFLVMEHLDGEPLDAYLSGRGGWLPWPEALAVARQALDGLAAVHVAGFVHRDVKPANIFRCSGGQVKLLDFGVIKLVESVTGVSPLLVPTAAGTAIGTPSYMAPEQATGGRVDARTDIYAMGLVLYRMLVGCSPFAHRQKNLITMLTAHAREQPLPPSAVASQQLPAGLDEIVLAALAKRQADRPRSAADLGARLGQLAPPLGAPPELNGPGEQLQSWTHTLPMVLQPLDGAAIPASREEPAESSAGDSAAGRGEAPTQLVPVLGDAPPPASLPLPHAGGSAGQPPPDLDATLVSRRRRLPAGGGLSLRSLLAESWADPAGRALFWAILMLGLVLALVLLIRGWL